MEKITLENELKNAEKKLNYYIDERKKAKKNIAELESALKDSQDAKERLEKDVDDGLRRMKKKCAAINGCSKFKKYYCGEAEKMIRTSRISNALEKLQLNISKVRNKIIELDDKVSYCNDKIQYYNNKIYELKRRIEEVG